MDPLGNRAPTFIPTQEKKQSQDEFVISDGGVDLYGDADLYEDAPAVVQPFVPFCERLTNGGLRIHPNASSSLSPGTKFITLLLKYGRNLLKTKLKHLNY